MAIRLFLYTLLFTCLSLTIYGQDYYLGKAEEAFENENFEEAVKLYKKVVDRNPGNLEYQYQLAFANYWNRKYNKAIRIGLDLIEKNPKESKHYRITANAYDLDGNYQDAIKILNMGIRNLPYNGELYFDLGVIEHIRGNIPGALDHWEQGIKAAPYYAENYYWAAKTYADSDEKVWAIMYSEMFLNLEKGTERFNEIGILLLTSYKKLLQEIPNIELGKYTLPTMSEPERLSRAYDWFMQELQEKGSISLNEIPDSIVNIKSKNKDFDPENARISSEQIVLQSQRSPIQLNRNERNRFTEAYIFVLTMLRENKMLDLPSAGRTIDGDYHLLKGVSSIRSNFLELWMQVFQKEMPIPLFAWQAELMGNNLFDAYNHWLMSNGDPNYFVKWQQQSNTEFQIFLDILVSKPLKVDFENYFVRTDYILK